MKVDLTHKELLIVFQALYPTGGPRSETNQVFHKRMSSDDPLIEGLKKKIITALNKKRKKPVTRMMKIAAMMKRVRRANKKGSLV